MWTLTTMDSYIKAREEHFSENNDDSIVNSEDEEVSEDFSDDDDSIEDEDVFEVLQHGEAKERKEALTQLDTRDIKTLLNVIWNVLDNPDIDDRISANHRKVLKPYLTTFVKLLDKKVNVEQKRNILQKSGHIYLPIFLKIIGEDLADCVPRPPNPITTGLPTMRCYGFKEVTFASKSQAWII